MVVSKSILGKLLHFVVAFALSWLPFLFHSSFAEVQVENKSAPDSSEEPCLAESSKTLLSHLRIWPLVFLSWTTFSPRILAFQHKLLRGIYSFPVFQLASILQWLYYSELKNKIEWRFGKIYYQWRLPDKVIRARFMYRRLINNLGVISSTN